MRRSRKFFEADDQLVVPGSHVSINILWLAGGGRPGRHSEFFSGYL